MQTIYNSQQEAETAVQKMKDEYGDGVSTLIVFGNTTLVTLNLNNEEDVHGHIWNGITWPNQIPAGKYAAILHTKTKAAAHGSEANLVYSFPVQSGGATETKYAILAWDSPWSGTNTLACRISNSADNLISIVDNQSLMTSSNFGYTITANVNQDSSPNLSCTFTNP